MASTKPISFGNALYKVPDLKAAEQFYSKAFGAKTYFDEATWIVFEIGNYQLWVVPVDSTEEHPEVYGSFSKPDGLRYWSVKDIDGVYQRFIDLGGTAHEMTRLNNSFREAIVEDPWGNKIGLATDPFTNW